MKNNFKYKIGIGITTHNRYGVFKKTYEEILKYLPENSKLVVVDDASSLAVPEATYRFENNVGIAVAKNKCFELLDDCEHIFLFDDDCYPIVKGWEKPYIESEFNHLMYIFVNFKHVKLHDTQVVYQNSKVIAYNHPRGCMLYYKHICLEKAGGMNWKFKKWGEEHGELSQRIYNLGLTPYVYMDIVDSDKLIYSEDEHQSVISTVPYTERRELLKYNSQIREANKLSKEYIPYKQKKGVILTTFLNGFPDVQRDNVKWSPDYNKISILKDSAERLNIKLVILHNCFQNIQDTNLVEHKEVIQTENPYFDKWIQFYNYLIENPDIEYVFLTDATDVEVLKNPFIDLEDNKLYVGDEAKNINDIWMLNVVKEPELKDFLINNRDYQLLNCGVIGGSRNIILTFLKDFIDTYKNKYYKETLDMPLLNYILRTNKDLKDNLVYGRNITTIFKGNEYRSPAMFKHK